MPVVSRRLATWNNGDAFVDASYDSNTFRLRGLEGTNNTGWTLSFRVVRDSDGAE